MTLSRIAGGFLVVALMLPLPVHSQTSSENLSQEMIQRAEARFAVDDSECQSNGREIVVCADENINDRYRLPFEVVMAGDPNHETVSGERHRIQANPGTCQSWSFNRSNCGSVGVSFGVGGPDAGLRLGGRRRVGR